MLRQNVGPWLRENVGPSLRAEKLDQKPADQGKPHMVNRASYTAFFPGGKVR